MGHLVTLYTSHQLYALLTSTRFVLTQAQKTGYEVVLSAPELMIQRCNTVNQAMHMVTPVDGTPHDCIQKTNTFVCASEYIHNETIVTDLTLFVYGSCFKDATGNHAGYAIVQLNGDTSF